MGHMAVRHFWKELNDKFGTAFDDDGNFFRCPLCNLETSPHLKLVKHSKIIFFGHLATHHEDEVTRYRQTGLLEKINSVPAFTEFAVASREGGGEGAVRLPSPRMRRGALTEGEEAGDTIVAGDTVVAEDDAGDVAAVSAVAGELSAGEEPVLLDTEVEVKQEQDQAEEDIRSKIRDAFGDDSDSD